MHKMWIRSFGRRIVWWYHFKQSRVNAFDDRQRLSFDTFEGVVHHQNYVIINQNLEVLVLPNTPSDSALLLLNFKNGKK